MIEVKDASGAIIKEGDTVRISNAFYDVLGILSGCNYAIKGKVILHNGELYLKEDDEYSNPIPLNEVSQDGFDIFKIKQEGGK